MKPILSLCVALMLPSVTLGCPTKADLDSGIRLISADDEIETFTRLSEHVVASEYRYEEGQGTRNLLAQGIYLIQVQDVEDQQLVAGTRATYTYLKIPGQLPIPTPGVNWDTRVVILDEDGLGSERQSISFGDAGDYQIGECTYPSVPMTIDYPDDAYSEQLIYLSDLGLSILIGALDEGEEPDVYTYTTIEAVQQ